MQVQLIFKTFTLRNPLLISWKQFWQMRVEPTLASGIVADGWTFNSFGEIVRTPAEFTEVLFSELCPNDT